MELLIVTGMSGAGKSSAANALEDLGYYCVDNIPPLLIPSFVDLSKRGGTPIPKIAIVTDSRGGELFNSLTSILDELSLGGIDYKILFLDSSDTELIRRYSETRRKHPLTEKANITVEEAVKRERKLLLNIRARANYVIDSSSISAGQLKKQLINLFNSDNNDTLNIQVASFGYKYGSVNDANLVFDVRPFENPYYVPELRKLTGLDKPVFDFVMSDPNAKEFAQKIIDLLDFSIPLYISEGKSQLIIAFGCTGGKHRSVTFSELIYKHLLEKGYKVNVNHRDIEKV